jgi:hypothetical protein
MLAGRTALAGGVLPVSAGTVAAPRVRSRLAALGRNRNYRLLWLGLATSDLGTSMTTVAAPLLALATTGSATLASTLGTVGFLAAWLFAVPGGHLADRFPPRTLMIACDLVRAALLLTVAVGALVGHAPIWLLVVSAAVCTAGMVTFAPASGKLLRTIIPADHLPEAGAASRARGYGADLLGPSLAGLMFAVHRALPFGFDALSYAVSAGCVLGQRLDGSEATPGPGRTSGPEASPAPARARWRRAVSRLAAGWVVLWREPLLRGTAIYATATNIVTSALLYIVLLSGHGKGAEVGVALSFSSLAGLAGTAIAPAMQRRVSLRAMLVGVSVVRTVVAGAAALLGGPIALAVALAAVMATRTTASLAISTTQLLVVPREVYGRVSGASAFIATALQPLAPLAAGVLLDRSSPAVGLGVMTVAFGAVALVALVSPGLGVRPAAAEPAEPAEPAAR